MTSLGKYGSQKPPTVRPEQGFPVGGGLRPGVPVYPWVLVLGPYGPLGASRGL